jgi:uncharacterized membrane protein YphA (DoxX/SURF4 family)
MQQFSLILLRISLALLMLFWGLDKIVNPEHGVAVADHFYFGILASGTVMPLIGIAQIVLAGLMGVGLFRLYSYAANAIVTGLTLLGVWRSVIDPWGWYLSDTNVLFFPSLIVFAASLVLFTLRAQETFTLDAKRT